MAAFFKFQSGITIETHVGRDFLCNSDAEDIVSVYVDEQELVRACLILDRKVPNQRGMYFCGDFAKTIAANWSLFK
jgi:hypothetical protein